MPSRRATTRTYRVGRIFHYPDGVALPGETVTLDEETAARGIALGALIETTPKPAQPTTEE